MTAARAGSRIVAAVVVAAAGVVAGLAVPAGGPAVPAGGPAVPAGGPAVPAGGPAVPAGGPAVPAGGPTVPAGGPAAGRSPSAPAAWTVSSGDVRVRCRMTVGGSFDAITSALAGTLRGGSTGRVEADGELRVDLSTLGTGIGLRDDHLRGSYLEVERGPAFRYAVLTGIALHEPLPGGDGRHETAFTGTLALHGVEREVEGEAALRRRDGRLRVEATLSLSLEAFDIPPPRYLGVGVRDEVRITVAFEASPSGTARASSSP